MPLSVIATPIGDTKDITLRAIEHLKNADIIIGEERKKLTQLIKNLELGFKNIDLLNEHSDERDLSHLLSQCEKLNVALVSDCGTPGFCDPGTDLVRLCRKSNIKVQTLPGASSLMTFLSGCGEDISTFYFKGFISAKKDQRENTYASLKKIKDNIILMDTPYRLTKTLEELDYHFSKHQIVIGTSLTQENELFIRNRPQEILKQLKGQKLEFVLAILK